MTSDNGYGSLDIHDAFTDDRTKLLVNDNALTKCILFNPSPETLAEELKTHREVTQAEWDAFQTRSQIERRQAAAFNMATVGRSLPQDVVQPTDTAQLTR